MNYSTVRTLQAIEVLVFGPCSAPTLAKALQINARTARRLLMALLAHEYVERSTEEGRAAVYRPTLRLIAMAAQLTNRHRLVAEASRVAASLHLTTGLASYVVIPSYHDVLVIASRGDAPASGVLLPAAASAAGVALLAQRSRWRQQLPASDRLDAAVAEVGVRGYAIQVEDGRTTIATAGGREPPPMSAVAVTGTDASLTGPSSLLCSRLKTASIQLGRAEAS
jgi:DNA-binding IclR family transcriptional regulator